MVFRILLGLLFFSNVCVAQKSIFPEGGEGGGGGGDINEMRVDQIRSDILNWIVSGGAKSLNYPETISYEDYYNKMVYILKRGFVDITFVDKDDNKDPELSVIVNRKPKTC